MNHTAFTIYDQKALAYLPPFFLHNRHMAERTFADCVNSHDHQFGKHPEDYTLFIIGEYDDRTGVLTPQNPELVGNGVDYIDPSQRVANGQFPTPDQDISKAS